MDGDREVITAMEVVWYKPATSMGYLWGYQWDVDVSEGVVGWEVGGGAVVKNYKIIFSNRAFDVFTPCVSSRGAP